MNYDLVTVDWDWLTGHKDTASRVEAILSRPKGKVEQTEITLASGSQWVELTEILETLAADNFKKSKKLIQTGLLCIMSLDKPPKDELRLSKASEGVIFATLSPQSVEEAVKACCAIDFQAVEKAFADEDMELDSEPDDLEGYLESVVKALKQAHAKKRGIVGLCG